MTDKQVCGIMAAIICNRLIELEDWSIEDCIKEASRSSRELMAELDSEEEKR